MPKPSTRVLALKNQYYNQYKQNADSWIKKYGSEAEQVMTGAAMSRAKSTAMKENKQRIREMVRQALMIPVKSDKQENPKDIVKMDHNYDNEPHFLEKVNNFLNFKKNNSIL